MAAVGGSGSGAPPTTRALYLGRLAKPQQMDFEAAAWLMWQLLAAPRAAHRHAAYQKQTKGSWARDDPAFAVAVAGVVAGASVAFSVALARSPAQAVLALLRAVVVDYLALGLGLATVGWVVVNRGVLRGGGGGGGGGVGGGVGGNGGGWVGGGGGAGGQQQQQQQRVEWLYAFDVHCSAFFASAVPVLMAAQLALLPLLLAGGVGGGGGGTVVGGAAESADAAALVAAAKSAAPRERFLPALLACTLYFVGLARYAYGTFLGYAALPFVGRRADALLWPVGAACCLYPVALLLRFNPARLVLGMYYPA